MTVSFNPVSPRRPVLEKCVACKGNRVENDADKPSEPSVGVQMHSIDPKRNKGLPPTVKRLTHGFDAWIVGSAADPTNDNPNDFDVQVPYSSWGQACFLIPQDARINAFGGMRFEEEGHQIDVWPGELGWIIQRPGCKWAWHPKTGIFITKVNMS